VEDGVRGGPGRPIRRSLRLRPLASPVLRRSISYGPGSAR
jgi:hypothetical protein